ncbi:MAG: hypothetical protein AB8G11_20800 [Saprospiraceae bacterium]
MTNLTNFKASEIKNANNIKGGVFCEWYINQRGEKANANNAEILMKNVDGVMIENGNKNFE